MLIVMIEAFLETPTMNDSTSESEARNKSSAKVGLTVGQILPFRLYIGSLWAMTSLRNQIHKQWTIVSLISSKKLNSILLQEITKLKDAGIVIVEHIEWDLPDNSNADWLGSPQLLRTLNAMENSLTATNNQACLVHCARGVSRSATICAAYLISKEYTLQQAMESIREVRPQAQPNLGFIAGLRALEQCQGNVITARERLNAKRGVNTSTTLVDNK